MRFRRLGASEFLKIPISRSADRPGLRDALAHLRADDTPVIWRLDRLGRSLKDLIARAEALRNQGAGLKSLKESIDTDSGSGRLILRIVGALAELERTLIRERTQAGLQAARAPVDTSVRAPQTARPPPAGSCGRAVQVA